MTVPQPHSATCPNCGAPIRFMWAQAVQTTCAYCRSVLIRHDLDLSKVGEQAEFPVTGSPIQIGTEGRWRDNSFVVVGRLTYAFSRGRWNEWHCILNDGRSAWLSDAQLEYAMTVQVDPDTPIPHVDSIEVMQRFRFNDIHYRVSGITVAQYVGTEGDLPFATYDRSVCRFVDLVTTDGSFGTIDGSEYPHLLFTGEYLEFDRLGFSNLRQFDGW